MNVELADHLRSWISGIVREEVARALSEATRVTEYLSTSEAAEFARVTQDTIRRWVREGRLESCGAGRQICVSRAELEKLMRPGKRVARRMTSAPAREISPEALALRDLGLAK